MKNLLTIVLPFVIFLAFLDCTKQESFDNANIMQIKNVGLRRDVFVRRYKMTSDYGRQNSFTPALLKEFIATILEPDYLLIQHAYDKGMHKNPDIQQKMSDYKINTIANNHPIKSRVIAISSEQLRQLYQKKKFTYDVDLVLTNSWVMTEEIHQHISNGGEIEPPKEGREFSFPRLLQYRDISYGEMMIPPAVLEGMETMKPGETSEPIYNSGIWTIITLNGKRNNPNLAPFDVVERTLVEESQGLFRYQRQIQLLDELEKKYKVRIHTEYYPALISAYVTQDNRGWIDKNKIDSSDLSRSIIQIGKETVTLGNFITNYNTALQNVQAPRITENDLRHFADDQINQYLLYLDVLDGEIPLPDLIQDQLVNKEHRLLLSDYLKAEIADKVHVTDADAEKYYEEHRERWQASFDKVIGSVKGELRNERLHTKRADIEKALRKKYHIRYNEKLLSELADALTAEKSAQAQTESGI
ncbi:hypothetical protein JW998_13030 [candidate division KSB1 bacterium]|nr:hypothetical protein [candidate division KSB1 bacterium]